MQCRRDQAALAQLAYAALRIHEVCQMQTNTRSVTLNTPKVAEKMEEELGEEQLMFAHGCLAEWEGLPPLDGRITVGLDGGYVHAREGENRKAGLCEVIAGKSVTWDGEAKCFSFVHSYNEKPKRRLYEVMKTQVYSIGT